MNYAHRLRNLARVFVDAQSLQPTVADMAQLAHALGRSDLLAQQVAVSEQEPPLAMGLSAPRMTLATATGEWRLVIASGSFDVLGSPTDPEGSNLKDVQRFGRESASTLMKALSYFGRKGHRLAFAQDGLLGPEIDSEAAASHLLRFTPFFSQRLPFEWDWRCAAKDSIRLGSNEEPANVIVSVKRVAGFLHSKNQEIPFDRLRVEFDVNTIPERTAGRFEGALLQEFFEAAVSLQERLSSELDRYLRRGLLQ